MLSVLQAHRELVGRQIRKARKHAGLSHDQLAEKVGTSRQHLIKLEKGLHLPRPEMLTAIAEATGKSESFFGAEDDEESDRLSLDEYLRLRVREEVDRALRAEVARRS